MRHVSKLSLVALVALSLTGCPALRGRGAGGGGGGGGGGTSGSLAACSGDFGATHAAAKIESFLRAASAFEAAASGLERDLVGGCQRAGRALGMSEADLAPAPGPEGLRAVCGAVATRLRSEIDALRAQAGVTLTVEARPPHCEVSVDAYASCVAECEAQVDPGAVELTCEGGELRGHCDATCTGRCAADVTATCSGVCEGRCEGTCSARAADGSCAGACDGTCHGACVVEGEASCTGECRGGCSVAYREPYCTGRVRRPNVSGRCQASCDAHVEAEARCTPGEAHVALTGGLDADGQARLARVQEALRDGVSAVLSLRARAERLRTSATEMAEIAPTLPESAAAVGIGASLCATAASGAVVQSMASVSVSVEVSVSFSASASASVR